MPLQGDTPAHKCCIPIRCDHDLAVVESKVINMNRKTKKLLGLGAAAAVIWYFYNRQQQAQAAATAAAAITAAQATKTSS